MTAETKTPRGGRHILFRWDPARPTTNSAGQLPPGIDVRGEGGYVILPPSKREDGASYVWKNPLGFFTPEAPEWLYQLVLEKKDHKQEDKGAGSFKDSTRSSQDESDRFEFPNFFRQVNSRALENLGSWVPHIFPCAVHHPGTGAWRIASKNIGRDLEEDLSIAPGGIKDFGEEKSLTPIDVVIRWGGSARDAKAAALWLCERMGIDPASLGFDSARAERAHAKRQDEPLIKTSAEFVGDFVPPDYLIDGLLQRQFIYSFTGQTGSGKTAVALFFAYCVAQGVAIGDREVQAGRVIYFAGENPDDVRQRWIAMAEHIGFDINGIDVHFVDGVVDLEALEPRLRQEITETGPATLVIIDTSAAYFLGDDENSNTAMGAYARKLRGLTKLPGGPTVLVNCHPVKNAGSDNLLPRGGGAFLAEVDGNLTCARNEPLATLHWQGKFRGSDFEPFTFETQNVTAERLKDRRGRSIYTVFAAEVSAKDASVHASMTREREDSVLIFMHDSEIPPSIAAMAQHLGFLDSKGQPQKGKVFRVLQRLKLDKLITRERGEQYQLTEKGMRAAKQAKYNKAAAGASYG